MATVSVVYHSGTGNTQKMAEAVLQGVEGVEGVTANLIAIDGKDIIEGRWSNNATLTQLDASDGIIFGSPTYMGSVTGQLESFFDGTSDRCYGEVWKDKVAAGFSVSAGPSGDKFNTMVRFVTYAMQMGMIWVGLGIIPGAGGLNRLSFFMGAGGQAMRDAPNEVDKKTGEFLGRRVAEITKKLHS